MIFKTFKLIFPADPAEEKPPVFAEKDQSKSS
jgi:hypothetical protein